MMESEGDKSHQLLEKRQFKRREWSAMLYTAERPEREVPGGRGAFENTEGIWQGPEKRMGSETCVFSIQVAC